MAGGSGLARKPIFNESSSTDLKPARASAQETDK